jgi:histidine triad (HIT) family protein
MKEDCIFCKIASGQIPSKKLYEDEELLAFSDINPAAPVHFLIIPKEHIETLSECTEQHVPMLGDMLLLAARLAKDQGVGYDSTTREGGFKTMFNTGPGGGQEVYHLHLHVLGGARPWKSR